MWKTYVSESGFVATGLVTIPIRNEKKMTEWDSEKFENERKK